MTPDTNDPILSPSESPPTSPPAPDPKAARIAELKAAYPHCRVVSFKNDPTVLVLRKPSDQEVLTIMDKDRLAGIVGRDDNAYNYDNGSAEILRLVEVPEAREVERLVNQRPMLAKTLFREVMALCRVSLDGLVLDAEDRKKAGGQLLGFLVDGKVKVLITRINRPTYERLDFQRLKSEHKTLLPSWLAATAKKNLLAPVGDEADQLWDRYPFLSNLLGTILFGETTLEVEAEESK